MRAGTLQRHRPHEEPLADLISESAGLRPARFPR
jgi:hypothetical protein